MLVPPQAAALRCGIPAAAVTCDVLRHPTQLRCAVAPVVQEERRYLWSVLKLAREIRRERAYVGYIFFVCVGLVKRCRPMVWEGDVMVDLLDAFAPWALDSCVAPCAVQGVCCCLLSSPSGLAQLAPVSDEHPLNECSHFVAACEVVAPLEA